MLFFLYDYLLVTWFLWEIFFVVGNCLLIMQCKERRQDIGRGAHEALKTTSSKFSFLLFCKFSLSLSLFFSLSCCVHQPHESESPILHFAKFSFPFFSVFCVQEPKELDSIDIPHGSLNTYRRLGQRRSPPPTQWLDYLPKRTSFF